MLHPVFQSGFDSPFVLQSPIELSANHFLRQILISIYTICQHVQILVSCTIHCGSPFTPIMLSLIIILHQSAAVAYVINFFISVTKPSKLTNINCFFDVIAMKEACFLLFRFQIIIIIIKRDKHLNLVRESRKVSNTRVTVKPIVIGALETVSKGGWESWKSVDKTRLYKLQHYSCQ